MVEQEEREEQQQGSSHEETVPVLKKRAESQVLNELKSLAFKACDDQIRALAECSTGRLFSVVWACRSHNNAVNECLATFSKNEELRDDLRRRFVYLYASQALSFLLELSDLCYTSLRLNSNDRICPNL